jgi:hypothetical protein
MFVNSKKLLHIESQNTQGKLCERATQDLPLNTKFSSSHSKSDYKLHFSSFSNQKNEFLFFLVNEFLLQPSICQLPSVTSARHQHIFFLVHQQFCLFQPRAFFLFGCKLLAPLSLNTLPFKHSFLSFVILTTLVQ